MMDMNAMIKGIRLSKLYWLSFLVTYTYCAVTVYLLLTLPADYYDASNPQQVLAAVKLTNVRVIIISIGLVIYPLVLLLSLAYRKVCHFGFNGLGDCNVNRRSLGTL